ncbi:MAG: HEAT repeat domain-containing protein [Planctomycetota bacterium]|nr:HEAT repeat domain-containing protein [Planctomycetota bacterium]
MTKDVISRSAGFCILISALSAGCDFRSKATRIDPVRTYGDARITLRQAAEDPDPQVRTKALEALAASEGSAAGTIILQSLQDDHVPVRFAAAMAAGDIRYGPAKPILLKMIKDADDQPKLKCAMIYALHRLGDDSYTGQLGRMIRHKDKWVRATAAMVMGRMGEPSAKAPLKSLQRTDHDPVVQLQVVEALAQLGDERSLVLLEAFTKSQYMEDRIIAVQSLGRLTNARSIFILRQLLKDKKQEPAVRLAITGSLARRGEQVNIELPLKAVSDPEGVLRKFRDKDVRIRPMEVTNLRVIAILALEYAPDPVVADTLAPYLHSPDGAVRVAAGKALLRLLQAYKSLAEPAEQPEPIEKPTTTKPGVEENEDSKLPVRPKLHSAGGKD